MSNQSAPKYATSDRYKYAYLALMLFIITASIYVFVGRRGRGMPDDRTHYLVNPSALLSNMDRAVRTAGRLLPQQERSLPPTAMSFPDDICTICFSRGDYIYLMSSGKAELTRVAKGRFPNISPDGKMIAFTEDAVTDSVTSPTKIKVADLETNQVVEIESLARLDGGFPRWSHDGTKLAFRGNKEVSIGVWDLKSGNLINVTKNFTAATEGFSLDSWGPDDKSLLCHDLENVYEIDLEGNVIQKLTIEGLIPSSDISSHTLFSLSVDKQHLLFDTENPEDSAAYLFNLQAKVLEKITPKGFSPDEPQWLPSGNAILFTNPRLTKGGEYIEDLYEIALNGGSPTLLIKNASHISYSTHK